MKCLTGARQPPVLKQLLLVQLSPCEHESQLATTERAVHRLERVDPDFGLTVGVAGVEMRRIVMSKYIVITRPRNRLIVGIDTMLPYGPVARLRSSWLARTAGKVHRGGPASVARVRAPRRPGSRSQGCPGFLGGLGDRRSSRRTPKPF